LYSLRRPRSSHACFAKRLLVGAANRLLLRSRIVFGRVVFSFASELTTNHPPANSSVKSNVGGCRGFRPIIVPVILIVIVVILAIIILATIIAAVVLIVIAAVLVALATPLLVVLVSTSAGYAAPHDMRCV
jgi:hypothetical protein